MVSPLHIITLFDSRYTSRGLAMLDSLVRHTSYPLRVSVLAMDEAARNWLRATPRPFIHQVLGVEDLGDEALLALRGARPHREFCWTATPCLAHWALAQAQPGETVVYLDADMMFFGDIMTALRELGSDGEILVHEHRYDPEMQSWLATSGRFNVGLVAFRKGAQSAACLERWRAQCLEVCVLDPARGLCGDQGYLNEWPELYPALRVLQHGGCGAAPWNMKHVGARKHKDQILVEDQELIFYHFHALRLQRRIRHFPLLALPAEGYNLPGSILACIYKPYLTALLRMQNFMAREGFFIPSQELDWPMRGLISAWAKGKLLVAY